MRVYDWQKENVFQQKDIILISSLQKISAPHFSTTSFLMIFCSFFTKEKKENVSHQNNAVEVWPWPFQQRNVSFTT